MNLSYANRGAYKDVMLACIHLFFLGSPRFLTHSC